MIQPSGAVTVPLGPTMVMGAGTGQIAGISQRGLDSQFETVSNRNFHLRLFSGRTEKAHTLDGPAGSYDGHTSLQAN